ncbi:MAG: hypothetical protein O2913_08425 [Chloroflexi bacterium]|nr:hypothetical protein [Chloroflexota bacterium]
MQPDISKYSRQKIADHLLVLRNYAAKSLINLSPLSDVEIEDLDYRMQSFLEIGRSIGCTDAKLAKMLFRDCFDADY